MTIEAELIMLTAGDVEPVLTSDELTKCLSDAATIDDAGLWLDDPHWTPTYDLNRAAAAGWGLKAGKVATDYTITIEQRELNRGQMIDNFLKLSAFYLKKAQPRYTNASGLIEPWRV